MRLSRWTRLIQIHRVLVRHRLDEFIQTLHFFRPLRFLSLLSPYRRKISEHSPRGERLRLALQDLGPIFVKFGQILSTRRDLVPHDIADELAKLQDKVAPFPTEQALALIKEAFGEELSTTFSEVHPTPLASASIAQVHAAELITGEHVIIKLVRPGIETVIRRDIELLYTLAGLAHKYWSEGKRLRPLEIVAEMEKNLIDELDMLREAASASQLQRNFHDSDLLIIPKIYWPLTKPNVLVQQRVYGVPISDIETLKSKGVNLEQLAGMGVEIFFTQVFKHSFFHADMHPGNIRVDASEPQQPRYIAIDFGIMGTLAPDDQRYLAENFLAFFNHDYRRVAELHIQSGWVPAETRIDEFEAAIRSVCEPIFARPLKEISFGQLLLRLFQTARRFNMEVQPQLVLLQKTLLNIEGLGRQLYPDLDLWQTAKPVLEQWMHERLGWQAALRSLKQEVPLWAETLPTLPRLVHDLVQTTQQSRIRPDKQSEQLQTLSVELKDAGYRVATAVTGASFIIGAAVIKGLDGYGPTMLAGFPATSWVLGITGGLLLYVSIGRRVD